MDSQQEQVLKRSILFCIDYALIPPTTTQKEKVREAPWFPGLVSIQQRDREVTAAVDKAMNDFDGQDDAVN